MRLAPSLFLALFLLHVPAPASAFSDADLIDGFVRTVFGSEFRVKDWSATIVKKFDGPVRVYVDDRSRSRRGPEVAAFVRTLPGLIDGLDMAIVSDRTKANFRVLVLDRADYRRVVSREMFGSAGSTHVLGKCFVRTVVTRGDGIRRSDAAIVADEGEYLFQRCMVEEVLQGLGPTRDDPTLSESVFNDNSTHATFTSFDRHLLNMLYHPLVRPGMTADEVARVLPVVAAEVRARLQD